MLCFVGWFCFFFFLNGSILDLGILTSVCSLSSLWVHGPVREVDYEYVIIIQCGVFCRSRGWKGKLWTQGRCCLTQKTSAIGGGGDTYTETARREEASKYSLCSFHQQVQWLQSQHIRSSRIKYDWQASGQPVAGERVTYSFMFAFSSIGGTLLHSPTRPCKHTLWHQNLITPLFPSWRCQQMDRGWTAGDAGQAVAAMCCKSKKAQSQVGELWGHTLR